VNATKIRIVIVEDHEMVRDALVSLLGSMPGYDVVGAAGSVREAAVILEREHPDVALVDLSLEDGSGTELVRTIRQARLHTRVLIMSGFRDEFAAVDALKAGVSGYVLKTRPTTELIEAIQKVMAGERFVSPAIGVDILNRSHETGASLADLSRREAEVFRLVVSGSSSKQISQRLCISLKTVETHRSNINRKLSVSRPSDLVRFAVAKGIVVAPHNEQSDPTTVS
jgi:DNA-binding NarL/FixJ family response regulator